MAAMCTRSLFVFVMFSSGAQLASAQCTIAVSSLDGSIPNASLLVNGVPFGATDANGIWSGRISQAAHRPQRVQIRALGFQSWEGSLACGSSESHAVQLEENTFVLGGATVVGSLSAMKLKESPIRTQVLAGRALREIPADDATEALDFSNGIRETIACGICGTNDININGLEGVYT